MHGTNLLCINSGNGHVINDQVQAKNMRAALHHHRDTSCNQNSLEFFFFLILWLFELSALLLLVLQAPVVVFTNLNESLRVTKHGNLIIEGCYEPAIEIRK